MLSENITKIEQIIEIIFKRKELIQNAFVHRSYLNENRSFSLPSNERLEFLGDACLELVVSEDLYNNFPDEPEGVLTSYRGSLVNTQSLAETSRKLGLGEFLLLSNGEETGGGRDSEQLLANTFEALLGAIYLDQGYSVAQKFVRKHVTSKLEQIIFTQAYKDAKSQLQELTQAELSVTPSYQVLNDHGPDHDKIFVVGAFIDNKLVGQGSGPSKQKAEIAAAENTLQNWDKQKRD